jgi:hypothetical protein
MTKLQLIVAATLVVTAGACKDSRCSIKNCQVLKSCSPNTSIGFESEPNARVCGIDGVPADVLDYCPEACEANGSGRFAECAAQSCQAGIATNDILSACAPAPSPQIADPLCIDACAATRTACDEACGRQHQGARPSCLRCTSLCGLDLVSCKARCPRR